MKRLTKSRDDVVLSGVLAGVANYLNVDPTFVRIIFVVLLFVGMGTIIPVYIVASFIIPKEPYDPLKEKKVNHKLKKGQKKSNVFNRKEKEDTSKETSSIEEEDWSDF